MGLCEDPCQLHGVCAPSAVCHVKMHRPICMCPRGYGGNPAINCTSTDLCKNLHLENTNNKLMFYLCSDLQQKHNNN